MDRARVYVVTSWDDATKLDLKICELLEKYDLKGTFFVVNNWIGKEISRDQLRHISDEHEIGAHTLDHTVLTHVSEDAARKQIFDSKKLLEQELRKPVTSFAYPKGYYNKSHVRMVRDAKYICARTTNPFCTSHTGNPYEINVTLWAYPHAIRDLKGIFRLAGISKKYFFNPLKIKRWSELGKEVFDIVLSAGGVFHLFGHAWQVDQIAGWQKLEDLLAHIAFQKNVNYMTLSDFVRSCYQK